MSIIDDQLKYFAVKVNNGSGCIFQPNTNEYTYILTVKHNIIQESGNLKAKINRYNVEDGTELNIQSIFLHPDEDIDLALILVDYIGESDFHLMYSKYEKGEIVTTYGYPAINKDQAVKTNTFSCKCDSEIIKNISFRIISQNPLFTFNKSARENVIGFSGCGLFYEEGENLILKGIFPELNNADGAHGSLIAYQIECFDAIIEEHSLHELIPEFLLNFKRYKKLAFYSVEPHINYILNSNIDKILSSKISPNQIADLFKGELYVPYTKQYKNKLANKILWKGWLELLTILNIISEDGDEDSDHNQLLKQYLKDVKLLFSIEEPALSIIIQSLVSDVQLRRFLINDICVVINSTVEPSNKIYRKRNIERIIPNIGKASRYDRNIIIDEPSTGFSFSCLHISHFLAEIGTINHDDDETPLNITHVKKVIQNIMSSLND